MRLDMRSILVVSCLNKAVYQCLNQLFLKGAARDGPSASWSTEPAEDNAFSYQESSFGSDALKPFESISQFTRNYGKDLSQADKDVIFEGLKKLYRTKVLPLEMSSKFAHFGSPPMSPSDFDAKPMVLVLGQYSVGKTSFTRSLLRQDFPGQRIGPEPTTDRFTAIMHSRDGPDRYCKLILCCYDGRV